MRKTILLFSSLLVIGVLMGCDIKVQHEHTFDLERYEYNETSHWHTSTCEHSDVTKDLEFHDYGDDNVCDVCGYEKNVSHTITYTNWPQGIDNPNPTSFDNMTEVDFDGTKILEQPGFSNVGFL